MFRKMSALLLSFTVVLSGCSMNSSQPASTVVSAPVVTVTPTTSAQVIKHVVVIFGENVSYDHYFGTYPNALNLPGESAFTAAAGTPAAAGLTTGLLTANPNLSLTNGAGASNPFRLSSAQAVTADQDHGYTDEESAFHAGKMDMFPHLGRAPRIPRPSPPQPVPPPSPPPPALTMGYYDGNSATALWNYAQHYSDERPLLRHQLWSLHPRCAVNLVSGQTNGVVNTVNPGSSVVADGNGGLTLISDADPTGDICSSTTYLRQHVRQERRRSAQRRQRHLGLVRGRLRPQPSPTRTAPPAASVRPSPPSPAHRRTTPHTTSPSSTMPARHQLPPTPAQLINRRRSARRTSPTTSTTSHDFTDALAAGNMPAPSASSRLPRYQDAHAANSDPIDEQHLRCHHGQCHRAVALLVQNTAIIIAYDDSDGWYDHLFEPRQRLRHHRRHHHQTPASA